MNSARIKLVRVPMMDILTYFYNQAHLPEYAAFPDACLPDDAAVYGVHVDPPVSCAVAVVHSSTYDEVPCGQMPPQLLVRPTLRMYCLATEAELQARLSAAAQDADELSQLRRRLSAAEREAELLRRRIEGCRT